MACLCFARIPRLMMGRVKLRDHIHAGLSSYYSNTTCHDVLRPIQRQIATFTFAQNNCISAYMSDSNVHFSCSNYCLNCVCRHYHCYTLCKIQNQCTPVLSAWIAHARPCCRRWQYLLEFQWWSNNSIGDNQTGMLEWMWETGISFGDETLGMKQVVKDDVCAFFMLAHKQRGRYKVRLNSTLNTQSVHKCLRISQKAEAYVDI